MPDALGPILTIYGRWFATTNGDRVMYGAPEPWRLAERVGLAPGGALLIQTSA